jgi:hypothetical protein
MNKNKAMHNETETPSRNGVSQDEIAQRAYQLWEASNRPADRDTEFWLQAEGELRSSSQSRSPKAAVSGDGSMSESPGASTSPTQKPEAAGTESLLAVNFDGARGPKPARNRTVAPTDVRRSVRG